MPTFIWDNQPSAYSYPLFTRLGERKGFALYASDGYK
jgi:hypothetical protein